MNATASESSSGLGHSEQSGSTTRRDNPDLSTQPPAASLTRELEAYKYALDQSSMVAITDAQGMITYANEHFCQAAQYSCSELVGQSYDILRSGVHADQFFHDIGRTTSSGQVWKGEICNRAKNGDHYWVDTTVIPFLDDTGKPYQYLSIRNEITQRKQAEAVLQQKHQKLRSQLGQSQVMQARLDGNNRILNLIAGRSPLGEVFEEITQVTEILSGDALCQIMVVDQQRGTLLSQAAPSLPRGFIQKMDGLPITADAGICAAAVYGQCEVIVADNALPAGGTELAAPEHGRELALVHGLKACWARPIVSQDKVVAVMAMYYPQAHQPSDTDRILMSQAVELVQIALERHAAEIALQEQLQQQLLLGQLTRDIRESLNPSQIFHMAVTRVRSLLQVDRVSVFCFDAELATLQGECVAEDVQANYGVLLGSRLQAAGFEELLLLGQDYHQEKLIAVDDIYSAGLSQENIEMLEPMQVRAMIMVPLMLHQTFWGLLCIHQCSGPRQWQTSELEFIEEITAHLNVALRQAELLREAEQKSFKLTQLLSTVQLQKEQHSRKAERERGISRVIQQIRQSLDLSRIAETATAEARKILECDRVLIYRFLPDWSGDIVYESVQEGCPRLMVNNKPSRWVDDYLQEHQGGRFRERKPLAIADIHNSTCSDCSIAAMEERKIRALMVVPIFTGDELWGLMGAYQNRETRDWKSYELDFLERISDQLGVAFQQSTLMTELKLAKDKAETANHAKSAFLANMSHELRTPLNAILGFSQLMQREANVNPSQKEKLGIINRSGAHLLSLINDVLEMSKIEAGRITLNESDFDLYLLCDSIYEMFRLKAEAKGLQLKFERGPKLPQYVRGDESKLRQVLINLVSNSLKFTETGEIALKFWRGETVQLDPMTSLSNAPIQVNFSVSDTGQGIESHELSRLFDAFYQTEVGRYSHEGTGLGLPISREFVELMGGEMKVTSQIQQGTSVSFSIRVPPVVGKLPTVRPSRQVVSLVEGQPDYRILIVEDRKENRMLLKQLLEAVGFTVRTAEHGEQAIAQWQDWQPHFIWMDLQMPVMDGFEATKQIRQLEAEQWQAEQVGLGDEVPQERQTFILALTASAFEQTRIDTLEAGLDDFISKPFQEHIIFEKMAQYLDLEYCYEIVKPVSNNVSNDAESSSRDEQAVKLNQQLSLMDDSWKQAIYEAARTLDEDVVLQQIEMIDEQYDVLSKSLRAWFNALRLDKIVALLKAEIELRKVA